jgi:hypothetical protein
VIPRRCSYMPGLVLVLATILGGSTTGLRQRIYIFYKMTCAHT